VIENDGWLAFAGTGGLDPLARMLLERVFKAYPTEPEAIAAMASVASDR
jgi:hypothetical protein